MHKHLTKCPAGCQCGFFPIDGKYLRCTTCGGSGVVESFEDTVKPIDGLIDDILIADLLNETTDLKTLHQEMLKRLEQRRAK